MTTELTWIPSRCLEGEWEAVANGIHYRVTSYPSAGRAVGAHFAAADKSDLGRFEDGPGGKRAAMAACQAHANTVEKLSPRPVHITAPGPSSGSS